MQITTTHIADVLLITPKIFKDKRGTFFESFNQHIFNQHLGREVHFVQDNHSMSIHNVLRGLHYQLKYPQGKLVRVIQGCIFDVAVDLRSTSPTFKQWVGIELSAENHQQLWIPEGFAHGFLVLSETAEVIYKTTNYWDANDEHGVMWDDQTLGIDWQNKTPPLLSDKDKYLPTLDECILY